MYEDVKAITSFAATVVILGFFANHMSHMSMGETELQKSNPRLIPRSERPSYYIKSKPPIGQYLYHHSHYYGLKMIANERVIRAPKDKYTISLTTDAGRYLGGLVSAIGRDVVPSFFITVDGLVRIPITDEIKSVAIPALYIAYDPELIERARQRGYEVYAESEIPVEYRHVMMFVRRNSLFVDENEYTVIGKWLNLPTDSTIFIDPRKIKRFKSGLGGFAIEDIRPLTDLVGEV